MKDEKQDLRIEKTKNNLNRALINLLIVETFEEISVSDLCKEAHINRSTFYTHYEDKYALLNDFLNKYKTQIMNEFGEIHAKSIKEYYIALVNYLINQSDERKKIFNLIMNKNRNSSIMMLIYDAVKEGESEIVATINSSYNNIDHKFLFDFYKGAIFTVVMNYMKNCYDISKEEVIDYINQLIPDDLFN